MQMSMEGTMTFVEGACKSHEGMGQACGGMEEAGAKLKMK